MKQEKECLNVKPFVCDVSCDTNYLSGYGIEKSDFVEVESVCDEKCKNVNDKNFADFLCYDNNSIGLKIMKGMGFKVKV